MIVKLLRDQVTEDQIKVDKGGIEPHTMETTQSQLTLKVFPLILIDFVHLISLTLIFV